MGSVHDAADGDSATMLRRIKSFDWSKTPLGPESAWPQSLRTLADMCLHARFPMTLWWGPDLTTIYNDAYIPILGIRHPGALGKPARQVWSAVWPTIGPQVESVLQGAPATWSEQVPVVHQRNGHPEDTWFTWSFSPVRDEKNQIAGVLLTVVEETQRVKAEEERHRAHAQAEAKRSEERAQTILESVADAFFSLGPDWKFTYLNPEAGRILGRPTSELLGKSLWDEYPGVRGSDFEPIYLSAMNQRTAGRITQFYPDHNRWYEVHTYPSADGITAFFRDVSEVKKSEEERNRLSAELQRQTRVFDTTLSSTPDFIYLLDRDARFHYVNKPLLDLWGLTLADALGKDFYDLKYPTELAAQLAREVRQVFETKARVTGETAYTSPTGATGYFEYIFSPVFTPSGEVEIVAGATRDISERKRLELELTNLLASERSARAESERAGKIKDEFLATLSHEVRTPLNAILGWSQIMKRSTNPQDIATGLDVIERNARSQSQIIEDLLDMSRIISGKVRLDVQRLDLAATVQSAVETARPTAEAKGVHLRSVIDPLTGLSVSGDPNRLQQVLWNLISNAIKFTPKDGLIQVLLERVDSHLEISVIDSGEGIQPDFLPFVFDRFRQADASTTRRHGGLGLGLSIVKQLVELHGGSVRVHSAGPSQGTTFVVALPLIAIRSEPHPAENVRRHPRSAPLPTGISTSNQNIAGVRVLVVDDEPDARALVCRLLQDREATVVSADSADEAVRLVKEGKFDVLVSDIGMPGVDGYTLIKRIRSLSKDQGGEIPAIALTAYARAHDRVKAISAGFLMHVSKPVEPVELVTMVAGAAGRIGRP